MRLAMVLGAAALLCGCTTTLVAERSGRQDVANVGILYAMPKASFDIEARFLVTDCRVAGGFANLGYELVGATVEHRLVPDDREIYRIKYDELNSAFKTTAATVTFHPNGMLKSLNVDQDDRSAQVMTSVASTAVELVKAYGTLAALAAGAPAQDCDAGFKKRLDLRKEKLGKLAQARTDDARIDADTRAADDLSAQLQVATAKLAEVKKGTDPIGTAAAQKEVSKLTAELAIASKKVEGKRRTASVLVAEIEAIEAQLTAVGRVTWSPEDGADPLCTKISVNQAAFVRQFAQSYREDIVKVPGGKDVFEADACLVGISAPAAPQAAPARAGASAPTPATPVLTASGRFEGIVYRLPALGNLVLKTRSVTLTGAKSVSVPQFGAKAALWLKNQPFDKNSILAEFNEDGSLSKAVFSAEARAERAAAAMTDTSKSIAELMQLRADAVKAKAEAATEAGAKAQQAQIDALDHQLTVIQKRGEIEAARAGGKDALDREKERLQKLIDVETKRQEYETLKKKASSL